MQKNVKNFMLLLGCLAISGPAATTGCGAMHKALRAPAMEPLPLAQEEVSAPLTRNHFKRDHAGSISEQDLRRVLSAPVFLEDKARIGVVQVTRRYDPDEDLPLVGVPAVLTQALEDSGLFEVSTEISTDWPSDRGIPGLRELAARYRSEYLLLYRHRFIDRDYTNGWGWLYLTVVGIFAVPSQTLESAGVMEATLFDVKTGTILFTVFERVRGSADENIWHNDRKRREMKRRLLDNATEKLAAQVLTKTRLLAAARPESEQPSVAESPTSRDRPAAPTGIRSISTRQDPIFPVDIFTR